ncbi:MAG: Antibiotic biosynthesis monooxygenase [Burkholderiales bacterium]|jgi:quinol monooxygenase YgiN|nr:Antibiotic biosynthesis monooxygenase [Burkholderiales bacterium]
MTDKIICIANLIAKTDKKEQLKKILDNLVHLTRKEIGCISYTLNESLNNPNLITVIEVFKDLASFEFHNNSQYIMDFKAIVGDLVNPDQISISLYKEID